MENLMECRLLHLAQIRGILENLVWAVVVATCYRAVNIISEAGGRKS